MSFRRTLELRRRCKARLAAVDIPNPWDVTVFCDLLAERRGRPLHLLPVPATAGTEEVCGAWAPLPEADYVFVKWHTSSWHREQIILHECAHMISEHPPSLRAVADWVREVLPASHWDPNVVAGVLMRARYESRIEQEAETLAGLIAERVPQQPQASALIDPAEPAEVVEVLNRFARALGAPTHRHA